jgi:AbrB family looped-hinge helix DNA binding protein
MVNKAGRIVIPKNIRDELRLEAGDTLALESEGERVTLRPVHAGTPLQRECGVWVFRAAKALSLDEANEIVGETRAERDRQNSRLARRAVLCGTGRRHERSINADPTRAH